MIISIASGKGGTGKTTVAVNLALALSEQTEVQLIDADVEEPNAHILLKPTIVDRTPVTVMVPEVDESLCDHCGRCAEICAYNTLAVVQSTVLVFEELCHGCGGCAVLCPQKAITERARQIGVVETGHAGDISFSQGSLFPGEVLAPPVIREVKRTRKQGALTIVDAPPGTSCPVVETVRKTDFCLLVTEPTPFGLNDLALSVELLRKMQIPLSVIINRADHGDDGVERYCEQNGVRILAKIGFDRRLAEAYSRGEPAVKYLPGWKERYLEIGSTLIEMVRQGGEHK